MLADAGQYQAWGSFWTSKEAYTAYHERADAWSAFRKALDTKYTLPAHLTTDQILAMTAMIKGEPQ